MNARRSSAPKRALPARAAVAILAVVLGAPAREAAASWYERYQDAERLLLARDFAGAEQALRAALHERSDAGCRLRTYGIRYRDYVPKYWLGVALHEQGRHAEARAALEEALADGVLASCAGTRAQALDAQDRLARLRAPAAHAAPAPPADSPDSAALAELARLRAEAVAAGAAVHASDLLAEADGAIDRSRSGEGSAPAEARRWLGLAISRARTEAPLAALLRREAEEAIDQARLASARVPSLRGSDVDSGRAALQRAEDLLGSDPSAAGSVAALAEADRALELLREAVERHSARAELAARREAETNLAFVLAEAAQVAVPADRRALPRHAEAVATLDRARRARAAGASDAASQARRARQAFAELAGLDAGDIPAPASNDRRLLPLAWSSSFRLPDVAWSPTPAGRTAP